MTLSVLVPTYRRPASLARCLECLRKQERPPDEVIVVVRQGDGETEAFLAGVPREGLPLKIVAVGEAGQVAALNAGLEASRGDVVAITDDDAAPWPDWLSRIEIHFRADPGVGGVGGRDHVHLDGRLLEGARPVVGRIRWFGRVIGDHHVGSGGPREVDVLKGANMSYRRTALAGLGFDTRLLGSGAQLHNDMAVCLAVKRAGWRVVYDPAVAVDHFPAPRFDDEERGRLDAVAAHSAAHNLTLTLLEHLPPWRRAVYLSYMVFIGTNAAPGLLQIPRFLARGRLAVLRGWAASLAGHWAAVRLYFRDRR